MTLYHFTCDHGRHALGTSGVVLPLAQWNPRAAARLTPERAAIARLSWFTDLDAAVRDALGLTSTALACDRTQFRYRVTADPVPCLPWLLSPYRRGWMLDLERAPGAMPRHWYVADTSVRVELG